MRLIARKASYYQERIRSDGFSFFPGAIELVREAASAGLTLGVVTGALRAEVEGALRHAGIAPLFKTIVAAEDVAEGKPHSEGYLRALDELNGLPPFPPRLFHPHEVLAIEDSPWGLEAASGAGLVTLAVAHSYERGALAPAHLVVGELIGLRLDALFESLAEATRA
jgi:beta-phosphoglucomutase